MKASGNRFQASVGGVSRTQSNAAHRQTEVLTGGRPHGHHNW
jgi:hypothetical protein